MTAPIVFTPKKDGPLRFFVAYREINEVIVHYSYPLALMHKCIEFLEDATVFSTLDGNSVIWKIEFEGVNHDNTAFVFHRSLFYFKLNFGLLKAPKTFQIAMGVILSPIKGAICSCLR